MGTPSFKQLETFFWAVELGSFGAAARHLNTTQPSVSSRIRDLELSLGVKLFDRAGHRPRLTAKGRELLRYAQATLALVSEMETAVADKTAFEGVVRLGAAETVALTWLPELIFRLRDEYPNIAIELIIDSSSQLFEDLVNDRVDLAFLVGPSPYPQLTTRSLGIVELAWMASPKLAIPAEPISPEALVRHPVLCHVRANVHYQHIVEWFRLGGAEPARISFCNSLATIINLTTKGVGLSLLAPKALSHEVDAGLLKPVKTTQPVTGLHFVIAYPSRGVLPAAMAIADIAAQAAAGHPAFVAKQSNRGRRRKQSSK